MFVYRNMYLTAEQIWFSFTVNLVKGPGKVWERAPPKKYFFFYLKIKLRWWVDNRPPPLPWSI